MENYSFNGGGSSTISLILSRLKKVRKTTNGWDACCPAHDDKKPSLCIGTAPGKILVRCQSQKCSAKSIMESIGLTEADLFTEKQEWRESSIVVAQYVYTDEGGNPLFRVLRKSDKQFPQERYEKGQWLSGLKGTRRVLFRLPETLEAIKRGHPILIAEGEKDVLALVKRGFSATCNPMGAEKWEDSYSESLRGADVVIVPDNDEKGQRHAEKVLKSLKGIAKSIRTIKIPIGKDAHDYFEGGGTSGQLFDLIEKAAPAKTLAEQIEDRRWNPTITPPPSRPIYTIGATPIATPGNLQTLSAQVKVGKSATVGALLAAPMALDGADTFGIASSNPEGKAVLHIDTEQSIEDHWHHVRRAVKRSGQSEPPAWLLSYCFTGFDAKKARAALILALENAAKRFGGIHSIHIDGVADLVCDVNDPEECNEYVAELHALAIQYDCPIICVIHFNPGTDKTRGHLGSQLERKAETNLRLDKDGEVTSIWSEKQRRAPILKGEGPSFKWCDIAGMHISAAPGTSAKDIAKIEKLTFERDEAFGERVSMRYNELKSTLMTALDVSDKTAERRITDFRHYRLIEKSFGNLWSKRDLQ